MRINSQQQMLKNSDIETLKNDFDTINKVIGTLINEVQDELSNINKTMLLIDHVFNNRDEEVANFSIDIARKEAWKFAVALARLPSAQQEVLIASKDSEISLLAAKIIKPGFVITLLLKLVKLFEWRKVEKIIKLLNRAVVI